MEKYHKIKTLFLRNPKTKYRTLIEDEYAMPEFYYLRNNAWYLTEKVDGTNIRIEYTEETGLIFGGRGDNAQIPAHLMNELNRLFLPMELQLKEMAPICLYGEGYGPKIQKGGGNYASEAKFVLFDIKIGEWWLERNNVEGIAKKLNIDLIPVLAIGTLETMVNKVKDGFNSWWGNFIAEGIVARPTTELFTRGGKRIITKLKYKDWVREK
jgi:hypothetical protein